MISKGGWAINSLSFFCIHFNNNCFSSYASIHSYETSSRRKQPDRSKRSHHRRSPTSSRHGHRQRHRDERSHSTSRRRPRERPAKDRTTPVKVKPFQLYLLLSLNSECILFFVFFFCVVYNNENLLCFALYLERIMPLKCVFVCAQLISCFCFRFSAFNQIQCEEWNN